MLIENSPSTVPLLALVDVALRLRVSRSSAYRLVQQRQIPFFRVGRSLRFSDKDVADYLDRRRVGNVA